MKASLEAEQLLKADLDKRLQNCLEKNQELQRNQETQQRLIDSLDQELIIAQAEIERLQNPDIQEIQNPQASSPVKISENLILYGDLQFQPRIVENAAFTAEGMVAKVLKYPNSEFETVLASFKNFKLLGFHFDKFISNGSFGFCLKMIHTVDKSSKVFKIHFNKGELHRGINEYKKLEMFKDCNSVVQVYGSLFLKDVFVLNIMEDLSEWVTPKSFLQMRIQNNFFEKIVCMNMLKAVDALHQRNIVHGDISYNNFMINLKTAAVKIIDFDSVQEEGTNIETPGTLLFAPYQRVKTFLEAKNRHKSFQKEAKKQFDVFSLGVLILIVRMKPRTLLNPPSKNIKIQLQDRSDEVKKLQNGPFKYLINDMLQMEISVREALQQLEDLEF